MVNVPNCLFFSSCSVSAVPAVAVSSECTPVQSVLPLPRGADLPRHACCRTSASDRISRRRRLSPCQRQSVPFPHEPQAVHPSARRHPYRGLVLSARQTAAELNEARQNISLPAQTVSAAHSPMWQSLSSHQKCPHHRRSPKNEAESPFRFSVPRFPRSARQCGG